MPRDARRQDAVSPLPGIRKPPVSRVRSTHSRRSGWSFCSPPGGKPASLNRQTLARPLSTALAGLVLPRHLWQWGCTRRRDRSPVSVALRQATAGQHEPQTPQHEGAEPGPIVLDCLPGQRRLAAKDVAKAAVQADPGCPACDSPGQKAAQGVPAAAGHQVRHHLEGRQRHARQVHGQRPPVRKLALSPKPQGPAPASHQSLRPPASDAPQRVAGAVAHHGRPQGQCRHPRPVDQPLPGRGARSQDQQASRDRQAQRLRQEGQNEHRHSVGRHPAQNQVDHVPLLPCTLRRGDKGGWPDHPPGRYPLPGNAACALAGQFADTLHDLVGHGT